MSTESALNLLLRAGVAFAFLYPPLNALVDPNAWIGYFPDFVHEYVSDEVLLYSFGLVEIVLGLWILSGYKILIPSLLATLMLVSIVAFNFNQLQVLFRDLSIALAALYLALTNTSSVRAHTTS